jgi:nitroreductase
VDAFLAIASKRDERKYADRPIAGEVEQRILDAGRLAGSSTNRQQRRFVVVESEDEHAALAEAVYVPDNIRRATLVIGIVTHGGGPTSLDAGRAAQNMMLAAWNDGVISCPNGIKDADAAAAVLRPGEDERVTIVLSFGYPQTPRNPEGRSPEEWSARANRKPLDELVTRI